MSESLSTSLEEMVDSLPCAILKLAMDDELTILSSTNAFFKLIGKEMDKSSGLSNTILKTVYSADIISYTQQVTAQKKRKDKQFFLTYRVLQKNGSLRWIMISGSKTDDNYQILNKSLPVYLCMAVDITDHMIEYKRTEQELEDHRTLLELSRELFFEYIIATDTLSFSELFREIFGKESKIKDFSKKLEKSKIIHPDDLPELVKTYKSVMYGKKQVRIEFRMIPRGGEVSWYVCYASIIFDENKNPYKVVGKLSSILKAYSDNNEISAPKIKLDALTKVYTKETAETMIIDSMSKQDTESLSALLLCEVNNYKGINEIRHALDGVNILTSIAGIFKKLFRRTDVIGRTGIGGFVIYMKDISSETNAYEIAERICKEVNKLYAYDFTKGVFISVGLVLVKGPSDYSISLANAKTALNLAKKDNGSSFEVFYPSLNN